MWKTRPQDKLLAWESWISSVSLFEGRAWGDITSSPQLDGISRPGSRTAGRPVGLEAIGGWLALLLGPHFRRGFLGRRGCVLFPSQTLTYSQSHPQGPIGACVLPSPPPAPAYLQTRNSRADPHPQALRGTGAPDPDICPCFTPWLATLAGTRPVGAGHLPFGSAPLGAPAQELASWVTASVSLSKG